MLESGGGVVVDALKLPAGSLANENAARSERK